MNSKLEEKDGTLIIKPEGHFVGTQEARQYLATIKAYSQPYKILIFDFSEVKEITDAALRSLCFSAGLAKQLNAMIAVVGAANIKKSIVDCGLENIFPFYSSLNQIYQTGTPKNTVRQDFIETLDEAVKTTLLTITGSPANQILPSDINNHDNSQNFQIGAIVGLIGKSFKGSLILGFSEKTFLNLVSKMFEVTYTEINDEISDGPAEVLNMLFGNLKIALNEKGLGITQAIPTTIRGSNLRIVPTTAKEALPIAIAFQTEYGVFYVELHSNFQLMQSAA